MNPQKLFLSFFGTGLIPVYPDIATMIAALLSGLAVIYMLGEETLFMILLAAAIIGVFEINKFSGFSLDNKNADSQITIDKAAGIWLALLIAYSTARSVQIPYAEILAAIFSFASFYLFESWKPSTIGWIDRNLDGGLGRMGSSILAGFAGGFLSALLLLGIEKIL